MDPKCKDKEITDEGKIAETFNKFFVQKIKDLKDNIDTSQI